VALAHPHVAVQRLDGLRGEVDPPLAPALAHDHARALGQVEVRNLEPRQLRQAGPAVEEDADDRGITAVLEALARVSSSAATWSSRRTSPGCSATVGGFSPAMGETSISSYCCSER
jgi:hypothetical protein